MSDATTPVPPEQPAGQPHVPPLPPTPPAAVPAPAAGLPGGSTLPGAPIPATPGKRSNVLAWAVGGIALVIALGCGGAVIAVVSGDDTKSAADTTPSSASPGSAAPTTATPTTAPASTAPAVVTYTPTKSDFKLNVKVLRKQCFGSAGCNITYRIDVTYTGAELDPFKTYEVTYEVKGGEDPIVNTFEVTDDSASVEQEEFASTRRSADKLTAVVTSVSEL